MPKYFTATAAKLEPATSVILHAPLFGTLVDRIRAGYHRTILDLGPARAATVELCKRLQCRLDIADLATSLEQLNIQNETKPLQVLVESLLPPGCPEATDVVLCWDILNYVQPAALTAIMNSIMARSRAGTFVHALIVYSSRRMPAYPGVYAPYLPKDDEATVEKLHIMQSTKKECDAPQYTPDTLKRCMQGYRIERAMLLSNGVQEFLFRIS